MLEKGIIHIPRRSELLSVSDLCLAVKSPPAQSYLTHGNNLHGYTYPQDEHAPLVFDRLDAYWAAAPLAAWDFSRYAFGVERRMCNFLPLTPYGMVAIVGDGTPVGPQERFHHKIVTDEQHFFDEKRQPVGPAEYRGVVETALCEAAAGLPASVRGPHTGRRPGSTPPISA